ncbi:hypothetical protein Ocin01_08982, partial [Orchesella cincta]
GFSKLTVNSCLEVKYSLRKVNKCSILFIKTKSLCLKSCFFHFDGDFIERAVCLLAIKMGRKEKKPHTAFLSPFVDVFSMEILINTARVISKGTSQKMESLEWIILSISWA